MSQSQWQRNLLYSLVVDEHETDGGGKQSPNSDKLSPRIVGGKGNLRKYRISLNFQERLLRTFPLNCRFCIVKKKFFLRVSFLTSIAEADSFALFFILLINKALKLQTFRLVER